MRDRQRNGCYFYSQKKLLCTKGNLTALGIIIGLTGFANSATAGSLHGGLCSSCATSTDFIARAKSLAIHQVGGPGIFQLASTSQPRTAWINVTGTYSGGGAHGMGIFTPTSAVPIDINGASIAGQSESSQEAYFNTIDTWIMGTTRSSPLGADGGDGDLIPGLPSSFINSTDSQVTAALDQFFGAALMQAMLYFQSVLVKFPDGTSASFYYNPFAVPHWVWSKGQAWKNGVRINRDGSPQSNPHSGTGDGGANVSNTGGGTTNFNNLNTSNCLSTTTVSYGSWTVTISFFVSC